MGDPEVRAKWNATVRKNYGVDFPMQDPETFEKAMRIMHRVKEGSYEGRSYSFQGYEDVVIEALIDQLGSKKVRTQFDPKYPNEAAKACGWRPDIHVLTKKGPWFVEVKSKWTLCGTQEIWKAAKKKAQMVTKAGFKCLWVCVVDHKNGVCVQLPKDWTTWSYSELKESINE